MARAAYRATTGADVSLSAATAKSVVGVRAGSAFGLILVSFRVSFSGVTAGDTPVLVEICYATFATNAPGTNSTTITPVQTGGRVLTHGMTAARNWTTEPTVLTVVHEERIHPQTGKAEWFPPGYEFDTALNEGFVIRMTAAQAQSGVRAGLMVERN